MLARPEAQHHDPAVLLYGSGEPSGCTGSDSDGCLANQPAFQCREPADLWKGPEVADLSIDLEWRVAVDLDVVRNPCEVARERIDRRLPEDDLAADLVHVNAKVIDARRDVLGRCHQGFESDRAGEPRRVVDALDRLEPLPAVVTEQLPVGAVQRPYPAPSAEEHMRGPPVEDVDLDVRRRLGLAGAAEELFDEEQRPDVAISPRSAKLTPATPKSTSRTKRCAFSRSVVQIHAVRPYLVSFARRTA